MIKEAQLYIKNLEENINNNAERGAVIQAVSNSDVKVHGRSIPFSYIPMFVNEHDSLFFSFVLKRIQCILEKITIEYTNNPDFRHIFGFSSEMERLICLPCNYDTIIPVGRYDLFLSSNETNISGYWFCEFNTDGTGGMSRDAFITEEILKNTGIQKLKNDFSVTAFPIIETITERLIEIYFSDHNAVSNPNICVLDFKEEGVMSDFDRFVTCFQQHGIYSRFVDVRDLEFDGEKLYDRNDGMVINGIYRRLVTSVLLERMDECQALIDAVEAEKVVLLGHFRTSLAHSKVINIAMFHPQTKAFLTDEENAFIDAHIPKTFRLNDGEIPNNILENARKDKNKWIIKPEEGFGAKGVYAGVDHNCEYWNELLDANWNNHYILQQFIQPGTMRLLGPEDKTPTEWPVMIGLYQAGGKPAGFYSRAGKEGVIDFEHGGIFLPTVSIKTK